MNKDDFKTAICIASDVNLSADFIDQHGRDEFLKFCKSLWVSYSTIKRWLKEEEAWYESVRDYEGLRVIHRLIEELDY